MLLDLAVLDRDRQMQRGRDATERAAHHLRLDADRIDGLAVTAVVVTFVLKGMVDYDTANNLVAALLFIFSGCVVVMAGTSQAIDEALESPTVRDDELPPQTPSAQPVGASA